MTKHKITKRIITKVGASAIPSRRMHVLPREGQWIVKFDGAVKASGVYDTRQVAINKAKKILVLGKTDMIVIHDNTGRVTKKITDGI